MNLKSCSRKLYSVLIGLHDENVGEENQNEIPGCAHSDLLSRGCMLK